VAAADPRPKADLSQFRRFDPPLPAALRAYVLFQLVAMVGLLGLLQFGVAASYETGFALVMAMLATMVATSLWLDGRAPGLCLVVDATRLAALGAVLVASEFLDTASWGPDAFPAVGLAYLALNALILVMLAVSGHSGHSAQAPAV
jgi:hypothetical protein